MEEEWRPVVGWEGFYEVSSLGRVRRIGRKTLSQFKRFGYYKVALSDAPRLKQVYVHRIVAGAFCPNPEDLPIVRHLNDVRADNRSGNLAWGTQSDNMYDAVRNGRNHEANKVTCVKGHPFDREERGQRVCLTCRDFSRRESLEKARNSVLDFDSPIHGTRNGYNAYACRCEKCRQANAEHQRSLKERRRNTHDDQPTEL